MPLLTDPPKTKVYTYNSPSNSRILVFFVITLFCVWCSGYFIVHAIQFQALVIKFTCKIDSHTRLWCTAAVIVNSY